jgi:hypothetical protein
MNEQVLERMLIDRSLGALPPDVDELLEAFLEHEPGHAHDARKFDETLMLARRALPKPRALPLPPLKVRALPQTSVKKNILRQVRWPVGIAAAFAIGFAMSLFTRQVERPAASHRREPERSVVVVAQATAAAPVDSAPTEFWSAARIAGMAPKSASPQPPRLTWTSPVRKPQLNY